MKKFIKFCEELINEAIPLQIAKEKYTRSKSGAYKIDILNKIFDKKDRLIYDLPLEEGDIGNENPIYHKIKLIFANEPDYGFELTYDEYLQGIGYKPSDKDKKQPIKIGKALQKIENKDGSVTKELLIAFRDDPVRKTKGKSGYKVVISRHPYDIAGMSTDRNWTSCMNLGTKSIHYKQNYEGIYKGFVGRDIEAGSIVAYLISEADMLPNGKVALQHPYSRILMKPHISSDKQYAYSLGKIYGAPVVKFKEFIEKWLSDNINIETENKIFYLSSGLYNDQDTAINFQTGDNIQNVFNEVVQEEIYNVIDLGGKLAHDIIQVVLYGERNVNIDIKFSYDYALGNHSFRYSTEDGKITDSMKQIRKLFSALSSESIDHFSIEYVHQNKEIFIHFNYVWTRYDIENLEQLNYNELKDYFTEIVTAFNWSRYNGFDYDKIKREISDILMSIDPEKEKEKEIQVIHKILDENLFNKPYFVKDIKKLTNLKTSIIPQLIALVEDLFINEPDINKFTVENNNLLDFIPDITNSLKRINDAIYSSSLLLSLNRFDPYEIRVEMISYLYDKYPIIKDYRTYRNHLTDILSKANKDVYGKDNEFFDSKINILNQHLVHWH